ncbi:MAG: uroporphyrinogen decarboxylase family protein [Eubacteriales bacterium]|nr:uroporphyrinogen decarboxylase family protein [Eubacteriales bacterium]
MTPKERLFARIAGKPVDKVPNLTIVMLFAAKYAGVPYGQFCSDYRALVAAQTKTAKDFGIDILSSMSDPYRECFDYGAAIRYQEDDLPICEKPLLLEAGDYKKLKAWDPLQSVRTLDHIRAIELFKQNDGDEYPILGWIEGAWAEFCDLTTVSEGMMMLFDEPDVLAEALAFLAQQEIRCAQAQLSAGADIIGIGDAVASLINVEQYRKMVMPYEKKMIDAIHLAGGKVKLHICGNINHLLPDMVNLGADIVDIDYMVDFDMAMEMGRGKCSICGHINPVGTILQGSVADVEEMTRFCLSHGTATSLISSGCEVPKMTPVENVMAIDRVLRTYSTNE